MKFTRKAFEKWLSKQPPRRTFGTGKTWVLDKGGFVPHCPLAHWFAHPTNEWAAPWSSMFADAVDRQHTERITAARALKILRSIP